MMKLEQCPDNQHQHPFFKEDGGCDYYKIRNCFDLGDGQMIDIMVYSWPTKMPAKGIAYLQHGFRGHTRSYLRKSVLFQHTEQMTLQRKKIQEDSLQMISCPEKRDELIKIYSNRLDPPVIVDPVVLYEQSFVHHLNSAGYHVIGADLPGHGLSGGPKVHVCKFDTWLTQLELIISASVNQLHNTTNAIKMPLTVIGTSLGANLLFNMLQRDECRLVDTANLAHFQSIGGMFQVGSLLTTVLSPVLSLLGHVTPDLVISTTGGMSTPYPWLDAYSNRDPYKDQVGVRARMFTQMKHLVNTAIQKTYLTERVIDNLKNVSFDFWANSLDQECHYTGSQAVHLKLLDSGIKTSFNLLNALMAQETTNSQLRIYCPLELEGLDVAHTFLPETDGQIVSNMMVDKLNRIHAEN